MVNLAIVRRGRIESSMAGDEIAADPPWGQTGRLYRASWPSLGGRENETLDFGAKPPEIGADADLDGAPTTSIGGGRFLPKNGTPTAPTGATSCRTLMPDGMLLLCLFAQNHTLLFRSHLLNFRSAGCVAICAVDYRQLVND
jgi:hypothetical protein